LGRIRNRAYENKQTIVLWIGLAVILLMGIFPPWVRTFSVKASYSEKNAGYKFILTPPQPVPEESGFGHDFFGIKLDVCRLCVQWVVVSVVTGGLILTFRDKKKA
jgi:hypothetical protein